MSRELTGAPSQKFGPQDVETRTIPSLTSLMSRTDAQEHSRLPPRPRVRIPDGTQSVKAMAYAAYA